MSETKKLFQILLLINYFAKQVRNLLEKPAVLNLESQDELLSEVSVSITNTDNAMLETCPSYDEVYSTLVNSNLKAAAGSDGIPGLLYKKYWDVIGESLVAVVQELFMCKPPSLSMCTALMIFSSQQKKT